MTLDLMSYHLVSMSHLPTVDNSDSWAVTARRWLGRPATGLVVAALLGSGPATAQTPSRGWSPADRTVLGDFQIITSVAAAPDRVFVTSPDGLIIREPPLQRWDGPFVPPDPALLAGVFASLVDPLDHSVWLARPTGWTHYEPELDHWSGGDAGGARITGLAVDQQAPLAGVYLRTSAGWMVLQRGGF